MKSRSSWRPSGVHSFAKHSGNGPSISPLASSEPPAVEMLSYQLNIGCAYKERETRLGLRFEFKWV